MANEVRYDLDSYDVITTALRELLNQYPGLDDGETIGFADMQTVGGAAMFPAGGAVIERERKYILGEVSQTCRYAMLIRYCIAGQSENRRANVKEWLDDLGRWLEGQTVTVSGTEYRLPAYPALSDGRRFLDIRRQSPAYLDSIGEDHTETWVISVVARYENNFTLLR